MKGGWREQEKRSVMKGLRIRNITEIRSVRLS